VGRFIRGRLLFSGLLLVGYALLTVAVRQGLGDAALLSAIARLALVLAIVTATITLLVNPWRDDRPSDRFPAIVQDFAIIAVFALVGTVLLRETLLTTSAVGAVVVGFALQDTLGNLFAGLAIQIEKPFRVGNWIQVSGREGQVQEVTWRATKLRTKDGEFLVIPNSVVSKEPVLNYSEPTVANSISVEVGASYLTPPNEVKAAILAAVANAPLTIPSPEPKVIVQSFGDSAINYVAYFWVDDYGQEREARDQVRTNIWYEFRRRNIEIPWPIQIQYERDELPARTEPQIVSAAAQLGAVDLFAGLDDRARHALSVSADEHLFAAGETIVRQGAAGDSMFVVRRGRVRVQLEPSGQEVAVIAAGGFFGEMSMLTGDPRVATVKAIEDVTVLEISSADFRELAVTNPALLDHVSAIVGSRRTGLEEVRSAAVVAAPEARHTFLARMRRFLHLKSEI
jgi:small-conductance mechanosensitive channel/CRP-like cAMP-binding protein